MFPPKASPEKKQRLDDHTGLPSVTITVRLGDNADATVFKIKVPSVTNNKAKLIAVLVPGQGLFILARGAEY